MALETGFYAFLFYIHDQFVTFFSTFNSVFLYKAVVPMAVSLLVVRHALSAKAMTIFALAYAAGPFLVRLFLTGTITHRPLIDMTVTLSFWLGVTIVAGLAFVSIVGISDSFRVWQHRTTSLQRWQCLSLCLVTLALGIATSVYLANTMLVVVRFHTHPVQWGGQALAFFTHLFLIGMALPSCFYAIQTKVRHYVIPMTVNIGFVATAAFAVTVFL